MLFVERWFSDLRYLIALKIAVNIQLLMESCKLNTDQYLPSNIQKIKQLPHKLRPS